MTEEAADGWIPATARLPEKGVFVYVRQHPWAAVTACLDERGNWKYVEYQHPHHVTHWKPK